MFFLALLPSMVSRSTRIPRLTSVPTAIGVWVQVIAFASLGLLFTTFATALAGA